MIFSSSINFIILIRPSIVFNGILTLPLYFFILFHHPQYVSLYVSEETIFNLFSSISNLIQFTQISFSVSVEMKFLHFLYELTVCFYQKVYFTPISFNLLHRDSYLRHTTQTQYLCFLFLLIFYLFTLFLIFIRNLLKPSINLCFITIFPQK